MAGKILEIDHVDTFYGKVQALHGITMHVNENEIVSIIGSNGAGKTTLMSCIMGLVRARSGSVRYKGEDVTQSKTHQIMRKGIVYIPEGREVFPNMSVLHNLEMGAYTRRYSPQEMREHLESMYQLFPRLKERSHQKAGSLSGGEQQMLAIARGLMSDPQLLMCDEPSLGLAPVIVDDMFDVLVKVNQEMGIPIIIVEQNAFMALSVSSRCYVLENGHLASSGDSAQLMESDQIKKAYLGG